MARGEHDVPQGPDDGTYAVSMYFDRLGHDEPERAVSFSDGLLA